MLVRLSRMDLIKYADYEQYLAGVRQSAHQLGYNTSLYEPNNEYNIIGDYGSLCKKLFEQDKISESHYYNLMLDRVHKELMKRNSNVLVYR